MKLAFMGTPIFAARVLRELSKKYDFKWVLSQESKKRGRGAKLTASPVVEEAISNNIKYFESSKITEELAKELEPVDLIVVVAYGVIIPDWFLKKQNILPLNIHYSLLPKYRGAAPVARAIENGDKKTGVTIMQIVKALDAGDIIVQEELDILDNDNTETITLKLTDMGINLLKTYIEKYINNEVKLQKQDSTESTYAKKLKKEEALINWSNTALNIFNKVRAFYPWPLAFSFFRDKEIKIIEVKLRRGLEVKDKKLGEIVEVSKKHLSVFTGEGVLDLIKLKPQNKKELSYLDFINGYKPRCSELFTKE